MNATSPGTMTALSGNHRRGVPADVGDASGGSLAMFDRIADPIAAIEKLGMWFFQSGLFGLTTPAQGSVIAMACLCERSNPVEICRRYHVIEGRLSMKAEAMIAGFNERGGKHRIIDRSSEAAEVELMPPGGEPSRFRFTWEEAQQERFPFKADGKTLKDNWRTPRGRMQMLWARVVSDGVRAVMPAVVVGTYTPEEITDSEATVATVTAAAATAPRPATADARAARRAELEAMNREATGAATASQPASAVADDSAEVIDAEAEAPTACSNAQLQRLASLGAECGLSIDELKSHLCEAAGVSNPAQMTEAQASELIRRLEETVEKKRSASA